MKEKEFYKYYIPALVKALEREDSWEQFNIKGPEHFLNVPNNIQNNICMYLEQIAGKNEFLDAVAYYFDAKSHGFNEIDGIQIKDYKKKLEKKVSEYKRKYNS